MSASPVSPAGKKLKTMDDDQIIAIRSSAQHRCEEPVSGKVNDTQGANNATNSDPKDKCSSKKEEILEINRATQTSAPMITTIAAASTATTIPGDKEKKEDLSMDLASSSQLTDELTAPSARSNSHDLAESQVELFEDRYSSEGPAYGEDDLDEEMLSPNPDTPRIVVIDDDFVDSETTDHSVGDHEDYMDDDSMDDVVFLHHGSGSDSDDSSGYMGYENGARYYYEQEDNSLDMESDEDEQDGINHYSPEEYLQYDPTPDNPYPKPDWTTLNELRARKCGFASSRNLRRRQNMFWFERYASNSLWIIQRMQIVRKLQQHAGCVNSLGFSSSANLICSGSDDQDICIWDWQRDSNNLVAEICTGHHNNVFQSEFCNRDTNVVTSSRDGSVRLIDIETKRHERLMATTGEIQKLAFINETTFLTCGTNAFVNMIDLRTREAKRLFTVRNPKTNQACQLHTINSHPLDKHVIAVAGKSPYVFLYDLRRLPRELHDPEIKPSYNLGNLDHSDVRVTSTAFNSTGDKLLISYNDDDLYVCRTDTCEVIHRYQGHRNKKTYKGCAWFGDNFVLSGSDDGHIYGWDLESEHIVCFLQADRGIVNCILVHPTLPMIASSGLEDDIKIWEPIADTWPQTMKGIKPQICKNTMRRKLARTRCVGRRFLVHEIDQDEVEEDVDQEEEDD